jgi:glucose-6-phosphate 1-epimerase
LLLQEYIDKHTIPGVVTFAENEYELVYATITSDACKAVVYLQGAHLTEWCPAGQEPVLYLSKRSMFAPGKAIRGGVPIIFPWFGPRTANKFSSRTDGPSHGFARTSKWTLIEATTNDKDVVLQMTLEPDDTTRSLGYDAFRLLYKITMGETLSLALTAENKSSEPLFFEEALHSYLAVADARQVTIYGLADTDYLDKTDQFKRKRQDESSLVLSGETDRPYLDTETVVEVNDPLRRQIIVGKENSKTTVVWNPWADLTSKLIDMEPDGWQNMVCIETANALDNAITLAPGESHTMSAHIVSKKLS